MDFALFHFISVLFHVSTRSYEMFPTLKIPGILHRVVIPHTCCTVDWFSLGSVDEVIGTVIQMPQEQQERKYLVNVLNQNQ